MPKYIKELSIDKPLTYSSFKTVWHDIYRQIPGVPERYWLVKLNPKFITNMQSYAQGCRVFRCKQDSVIFNIYNEKVAYHNILGPVLMSWHSKTAMFKLFGQEICNTYHDKYRQEYLATPEEERENYLGYLYATKFAYQDSEPNDIEF